MNQSGEFATAARSKALRQKKFQHAKRANKSGKQFKRWCWTCRWEVEQRQSATVAAFIEDAEGDVHKVVRGANKHKNWELLEEAEKSHDTAVVFGADSTWYQSRGQPDLVPRTDGPGQEAIFRDDARKRAVLDKASAGKFVTYDASSAHDIDPMDVPRWLAHNENVFAAWQSSKKGRKKGKRADLERQLAEAGSRWSDDRTRLVFDDLVDLARKGDVGVLEAAFGVTLHVARIMAEEVLLEAQEESSSDSRESADDGIQSDGDAPLQLVQPGNAIFIDTQSIYQDRLERSATSAAEFVAGGTRLYCPHHERSKKKYKKKKVNTSRLQRRSNFARADVRGAEDVPSHKDGYLSC